jgi:glutathione S-transferase
MGSRFSVADAYLYAILRWSPFVDIDLAQWPVVAAYKARVEARPHVREALLAEGLIKERAKAVA